MRSLKHLFVVALGLSLFAACADQAEGERCDLKNGNDDCESGLECVPVTELVQGTNVSTEGEAALCCPSDPQAATVDACFRRSHSIGGGDAGTGGSSGNDAGTGGSSSSDASTGGASSGGAASSGGSPADASEAGPDASGD